MEESITLQNVADIVRFIVPGYIMLRIYTTLFARPERSFFHLMLECLVYSLPLVACADWVWKITVGEEIRSVTVPYAGLLLVTAVVAGCVLGVAMPFIVRILQKYNLASPKVDFVGSIFRGLGKDDVVTVTLKSEEVFSGRPIRSAVYASGSPREYYFDSVAWYDKATGQWDVRSGGIIINLDEVAYIETT